MAGPLANIQFSITYIPNYAVPFEKIMKPPNASAKDI